LLLVHGLASVACESPDPKAELEMKDLETYWVIDKAVGTTEYIAPAVRLKLLNKGAKPRASIEAKATFRRKGEEDQEWGSAWERIATSAKPLAPGQETVVVLKSEGRYYSTGTPESMFEHELFKDAKVEIFIRMGASSWVKFGAADVERRVGSRAAQAP
jgi:hypothetical protein